MKWRKISRRQYIPQLFFLHEQVWGNPSLQYHQSKKKERKEGVPVSHFTRALFPRHAQIQTISCGKKKKKAAIELQSVARSTDKQRAKKEEHRIPKVMRTGWAVRRSVGLPRWRGFADERTVAFSSSSSGIGLATSILGRSATWLTSALLARRRRRLHTAPPTPAKRARSLLVIRPRELLFPTPHSRSQVGPRRDGEPRRGNAGRQEERSPGGGRERWMQISQAGHGALAEKKRSSPDAPRLAFCLPTAAWPPASKDERVAPAEAKEASQ